MACSVDCAATTFNEPLNSLHWCAGCAGATGNNTAFGGGKDPDPVMSSHVQGLIAIDDLHSIGALSKVTDKLVINVPGCPPSEKNIVGTLLHYILQNPNNVLEYLQPEFLFYITIVLFWLPEQK